MNRVCLDTSAYALFARGLPAAVEAIRRAREVLMPVVTLGELRAGFLLGSRTEWNEQRLRAFLDHPAVRVLEVDEEASHRYAEVFATLRRAGTPIPANDLWIAALAIREGAVLLTSDEHFRRIPQVVSRLLDAR